MMPKPKPKPNQKTMEELMRIVLGGEKTSTRSIQRQQSRCIEVGHRINTNQKREIIQKSSDAFKTRTAFLKRI